MIHQKLVFQNVFRPNSTFKPIISIYIHKKWLYQVYFYIHYYKL